MLVQIKQLANDIAKKHNAKVELYHYEPLYKDLRSDMRLNEYYKHNFNLLGEKYTIFLMIMLMVQLMLAMSVM